MNMRDVLQKELQDPNMADAIRLSTDYSNDELLEGVLDGAKFKRLVANAESEVLAVSAFIDGSCPVNGLGSKANTNNMTYVCLTVENLPDYIKSKSHGNIVIAAGYTADFEADNYSTLKHRLTAQLNDLYTNGITVNVRGESIHFRVALVAWKGDNLGLNKLFCLHSSFACGSACRRCGVEYKELDRHLTIPSLTKKLRNVEDYKNDVNQNARGVKKDCELNDIPEYHIYANFFHDVMHDVKEGWDKHVLSFVLNYLKDAYKITLSDINQWLNAFPFRYHDKATRPSNLCSTGIRQSSEQMNCLMRVFPLIVGEYVNDDDEVWKYLIRYVELRQVIFAPKKTKELLKKQSSMIEDHLQQSVLFKVRGEHQSPTMLFKSHFLLHLEESEKELGPAGPLSCLPYERIMGEMKKYMKTTKNFKNIPFSVMYRRQLERAAKSNNWSATFPVTKEQDLFIPTGVPWYSIVSPYLVEGRISSTQTLSIKGTHYTKFDFVVIQTANGIPRFGQICETVMTPSGWKSVLLVFSTSKYNNHFGCYEVNETEQYVFYDLSSVAYHHPLHRYTVTFKGQRLCLMVLRHAFC